MIDPSFSSSPVGTIHHQWCARNVCLTLFQVEGVGNGRDRVTTHQRLVG